jgi:hypothetical protein
MPTNSKTKKRSLGRVLLDDIKRPFIASRKRAREFLVRRPHRSFRMTRRRDYNRSLKLPGYIAFTALVNRTLREHRKTFLIFTLVYVIGSGLMVGLASQENYTTLTSNLQSAGAEVFQVNVGQIGQAGVILFTIATTGLNDSITEVQQVYAAILAVLAWLVTVWLLRNLMAGRRVKVRDGLYNAGAPLVPTLLVTVILFVQLIPVGIAAIGYASASATGLLNGGVEAMLFWVAASLLVLLSLYLLTTTFFALVIVTLPGTYPMKAMRVAGDMVVGRRIRVLLRIIWMGLCIALAWAIIMIPIILLDAWLKSMWGQIQWLPIIPVVFLIMSTGTVIWMASYIYILYRKVIDDDAKPA